MLQSIIITLFFGLFMNLKTKKQLIIRMVAASVLGIFFFIGFITLLTEEHMIKDGDNLVGLALLPLVLFFVIRLILDVRKYLQIDREWKAKHPNYREEKEADRLRKQQEREHERKMLQYKDLIEKSGVKFFIKYYPQIKRFPLRDVTVEENLSTDEREERLNAAKQIIDKGLTKLTISQILQEYGDMLSEEEVANAQKILNESGVTVSL